MLEVTTCSWRVREGYEEDRVDVFGSCCLFESGTVGVDVEERVSGGEGTKGSLHYWLHIGRI
jgi:hypothetical protein